MMTLIGRCCRATGVRKRNRFPSFVAYCSISIRTGPTGALKSGLGVTELECFPIDVDDEESAIETKIIEFAAILPPHRLHTTVNRNLLRLTSRWERLNVHLKSS